MTDLSVHMNVNTHKNAPYEINGMGITNMKVIFFEDIKEQCIARLKKLFGWREYFTIRGFSYSCSDLRPSYNYDFKCILIGGEDAYYINIEKDNKYTKLKSYMSIDIYELFAWEDLFSYIKEISLDEYLVLVEEAHDTWRKNYPATQPTLIKKELVKERNTITQFKITLSLGIVTAALAIVNAIYLYFS